MFDVQQVRKAVGQANRSTVAARSSEQSTTSMRPVIQTKLSVGPVGDRCEQEADRVAQAVMRVLRSQQSDRAFVTSGSGTDRVQPMRSAGATDPSAIVADRVENRQPHSRIRARATSPTIAAGGGALDVDTDSRIRRATGRGAALEPVVLRSMQGAFGADFSTVRVHDDAEAHELSQRVRAKAFTTGSDIFFGSGEYDPSSHSGQELIAHELTHTLQQRGSIRVQRVVTAADLSDEYRGQVGPLMKRITGFPHGEKKMVLQKLREEFSSFCKSADSTVPAAEQKIDELQRAVTDAHEQLNAYNERYRIMSESMEALSSTNPGSYQHWAPRFEKLVGDPLTLPWSDVEVALTSGSDFGSALNKLKDKHPEALKAQEQATAKRKEVEAKALQDKADKAAAKAAAEQQAAAIEAARRAAIAEFVKSHNPSQVFKEYAELLNASTTTVGDKYKGGKDPVTGEFEDGVTTYSRKYTFGVVPKVGEVHIHWRPFGNKWKPTKWHFKRAGHEFDTEAKSQRDLTLSEVQRLGITGVGQEQVTDQKIGQ